MNEERVNRFTEALEAYVSGRMASVITDLAMNERSRETIRKADMQASRALETIKEILEDITAS